jgi:hypothetical protein
MLKTNKPRRRSSKKFARCLSLLSPCSLLPAPRSSIKTGTEREKVEYCVRTRVVFFYINLERTCFQTDDSGYLVTVHAEEGINLNNNLKPNFK